MLTLLLFACDSPIEVHGVSLGDSLQAVLQTLPSLQAGPPGEDADTAGDELDDGLPFDAGTTLWRTATDGGTEIFGFEDDQLTGFIGTYDDATGVLLAFERDNGPPDDRSSAMGVGTITTWKGRGAELVVTQAGPMQMASLHPIDAGSRLGPAFVAGFVTLDLLALFVLSRSRRRLEDFLARHPSLDSEAALAALRDAAKGTMHDVLRIHAAVLLAGGVFVAGVFWGDLGCLAFLAAIALSIPLYVLTARSAQVEARVHSMPASDELRPIRDQIVRTWKSKALPDW